jgi:hypothetical protein
VWFLGQQGGGVASLGAGWYTAWHDAGSAAAPAPAGLAQAEKSAGDTRLVEMEARLKHAKVEVSCAACSVPSQGGPPACLQAACLHLTPVQPPPPHHPRPQYNKLEDAQEQLMRRANDRMSAIEYEFRHKLAEVGPCRGAGGGGRG